MRSGLRGWFWLALVVVLVVLALLGGRPPETGTSFDPDGVGPAGSRALRETVEQLGAEVEVTDQIGPRTDVVLVLEDRLTDAQRDDLVDWVDEGGLLVIGDAASPLTPLVVGDLGGAFDTEPPPLAPGGCTVEVLDDVGVVEPGFSVAYQVGENDRRCYGGFVVEAEQGRGLQRSLGGATAFTNDRLGDADNAVLAARLLEVEPGTRITWLVRDASAAQEGSLWSLVAPGTRAALLQLAIAAVVYVLVRSRRLGPPLREPQAVQLAGSELVGAVGNLLQRRRDPDLAARLLRDDLRRELAGRLGLPASTPPDVVARIVGDRLPVDALSIDRARVQRALVDEPVLHDEALVALARDIEAVRQEVLHDRSPTQ